MLTLFASLLLAPAPLTPGKTIDLPKPGRFDYMAVDSKNRRVFASHTGAGTLAVLDLNTGKLQEIETGVVNGVQIDKKTNRVFAGGQGKKLVAFDRDTLQKVGEATLEDVGDDIVVDSKRGEVYVCHDDGNEDWVFDATTLAPKGKVTIAGAPEYIEYDATTDRLYQNIKPTNQIQVIDPEGKKVVANWDTAPMTSPHGLALDRKSGRAFSAGKNGKLLVVDLTTGKILATVDIAPGTDQIAFDSKLKRVYCPGNGTMSVVQETEDGAVKLGDVAIPKGVHTLAVDPKTHDVWVSWGDGSSAHLQQLVAAQ